MNIYANKFDICTTFWNGIWNISLSHMTRHSEILYCIPNVYKCYESSAHFYCCSWIGSTLTGEQTQLLTVESINCELGFKIVSLIINKPVQCSIEEYQFHRQVCTLHPKTVIGKGYKSSCVSDLMTDWHNRAAVNATALQSQGPSFPPDLSCCLCRICTFCL